ncbi:MAG: endopeptidase La, partial [Verrucomicrobia bacterium]|nr:endopeptidase La [Verrucomicrobiota bacterium]
MHVARHEIDRLAAIPFSSPEYAGTRNYLDWILNLPWRKEDQNPRTLVEAKRILNRNHYGLEALKDRLLEYMAVMKVSDSSSAPILCLVGPPGVGKTSLG